ncbi:hypothetical protein VaNZ11_001164 [Volvox africanus]|uniref:Queuine tRNA-ribosyltransferase accessory subunit 2 n=1 Tax=Volvox africanus TaxID=51714 RepID=A0ABQ5RP15_9CHLO|nr:hypothetical protein VaNZ11_001164 [Volvox africanus]
MLVSLAAHSMATTATHFSVKARDDKARCGILSTRNGVVETPAVLLYTRRGGPLNLTSPDMLAAVTPPVQGVQLSAMQFLENPDASILREYGRGAHGFLCLEGFPVLASNRDPTMYEYAMRPSTDKEVHVSIHSGGHMVSPERYMETMAALKPDLFVSLCDEVPADATSKRVATSIMRTAAWLDACLQLHYTYQHQNRQATGGGQEVDPQPCGGSSNKGNGACGRSSADGKGSADNGSSSAGEGPLAGSLLLAALAGGGLAMERARAAAAVADKEGVGGYALCGLGAGEAPEQRPALIAASLGALSPIALERRPVFASGLSASPEDILAAVAEGVDLMDCAFVAQVTAGGYALTFPLRPHQGWRPPAAPDEELIAEADRAPVREPQPQLDRAAPPSSSLFGLSAAPGLGPDTSIGADDTKINLWSTSYRLDKGPLLPGCGCFACRRHSRAYVHHLLNTHEMLGDVLLEAHNTGHINAFLQAIREAITEGRFEEYRQWFRSLRSAPLVPAPRRVVAKRRASAEPSEPIESEPGTVEVTMTGAMEVEAHVARGGSGSREQRRSKWVSV